jgi:hypothetical protein
MAFGEGGRLAKRAVYGWTLVRDCQIGIIVVKAYILYSLRFSGGFSVSRPLKNVQFCSRSRKAKILTAGIP